MQRLGKNHGGYHGETIDIRAVLREELEDLNDYLDLVDARVRDQARPRLTHAEVKKRYGLQ